MRREVQTVPEAVALCPPYMVIGEWWLVNKIQCEQGKGVKVQSEKVSVYTVRPMACFSVISVFKLSALCSVLYVQCYVQCYVQ